MKYYFKVLVRSFKYVAIFLGIYILGAPFIGTLANFFANVPFVPTLIMLGIPTIVVFLASVFFRKRNKDTAKAYRAQHDTISVSLKDDIIATVKTKNYLCEALVYITYLGILCIIGGRIIFHSKVIQTLLMLLVSVIIFCLLDLISWLYVHKQYMKDKII